LKGKIKTIIRDKSFGFISTDDGNDVFFHRSSLDDSDVGFDALEEGNEVEFDMEQGPKGPRAANLKVTQ
jgi:CspA family cold shock protein